jgi:hypothetical protein
MNYEPLHNISDRENNIKTDCKQNDLCISICSNVSEDSIAQNKIPRRLKKTFYYSLILLVTAIILLIIGIEESFRNGSFQDGISFYVLSIIVFIPGGYYVYQFFKAKMAKDVENKRGIFEHIPEL